LRNHLLTLTPQVTKVQHDRVLGDPIRIALPDESHRLNSTASCST
jgi:hypothetical protein